MYSRKYTSGTSLEPLENSLLEVPNSRWTDGNSVLEASRTGVSAHLWCAIAVPASIPYIILLRGPGLPEEPAVRIQRDNSLLSAGARRVRQQLVPAVNIRRKPSPV